ncbi:MAG: hypothetical protein JXR03_20540 [Cyclobacteriaceae bacterium]
MPYNLSHLNNYLQDATPSEISQLLRSVRYDIVVSAVERGDYNNLCDKYLELLKLEDEFIHLDQQGNEQ